MEDISTLEISEEAQQDVTSDVSSPAVETNSVSPDATPEAPNNQELLNSVMSTEFSSKLSQTMLGLILSEAIKAAPDERYGYKLDLPVALNVLRQLQEMRTLPASPTTEASPSLELSKPEVQEAFLASLEAFSKMGVLSDDVRKQVEKIVDPNRINLTDNTFARFAYQGDRFPSSPEKKGEMVVGRGIVELMNQKLQEAANNAGVRLTQEQTKKVALRLITSHEYGHAVHNTKKIERLENALIEKPDEEFIRLIIDIDQEVDETIANEIAPNPQMAQLYQGETVNGAFDNNSPRLTVSERVAMGFQNIGVIEALKELDLEPGQVQMIVEELNKTEARLLKETTFALDEARARGFSMKTFGDAVNELATEVRDADKQLYELLRAGFNSRNFGYYFPLSEDEIKKVTNL